MFRFGVIGTLSTLVHMIVALALVKLFTFNPFVANTIAFGTAFAVSFFGHFWWTFRHFNAILFQSLIRFGLIALLGFLANSLLLAALIDMGISKGTSVVLAVTIVPLISYVASRQWAFRS